MVDFTWTGAARVGRVNLDGTGAELLISSDDFGDSPGLGQIAVDHDAGIIYWANTEGLR